MLYIVLPVHNRKEISVRFIEQLKRQTYQDFRIIVIDDGCTDRTYEAIQERMNSAIRLNGNGNLWWAGSMQKAYEWINENVTGESLVMIANNDIIFEDDFLEKSVKQFVYGTILAPKVYVDTTQIDGPARIEWKSFKMGLSDKPNFCSTRGIILSALDFIRIGEWHTKILPHYLSDSEWTYRAHKKGIVIVEGESVHVLREEDEVKSVKLFSKRNPANPIYYSVFVLLSCPKKYIPKNLFKLWYGSLKSLTVKITHKLIDVKINLVNGKWFTRGAWVTLTINTNCQLRCPDCPLWIGNESFPQWKQCTIDQWKGFVKRFPEWVSLYSICGGEPTMLKWLAEFVNWLLDKGHHVAIYSNLFDVSEILKMKRSARLVIHATYHHKDDKEKFIKSYNLLKDKYRITVYEFDHPMKLPFSVKKEFYTPEDIMNLNSFHAAPDAPIKKTIYIGAEDNYEKPSK